MMVPYDQRWGLLATFSAGFIYKDGKNSCADNGLTNEPLQNGNATLVGYKDGRVGIVEWSGGPNAGPNLAWARQSLPPIIWNGKLNPALNDSSQRGYTLSNAVRAWRTGVGIDRRGNLIIAAADFQTVITLAQILQRAGAVRAMQFDINREWHTLITYTIATVSSRRSSSASRSSRHPLPRPRRPRLPRRLPAPAGPDHRPIQAAAPCSETAR